MLKKSNPLKTLLMQFLFHFDPVTKVLSNGVGDTILQQFLLNSLYIFDSFGASKITDF